MNSIIMNVFDRVSNCVPVPNFLIFVLFFNCSRLYAVTFVKMFYLFSTFVHVGEVNGVKRAAIRKLKQELGIDNKDIINEKSIKYLTRLHYWAADKETHGEESVWGEHEIDYVLFVQADVSHTSNPEEVQDTKYVSFEELEIMMKEESGLLWSPWFRIIEKKILKKWWEDLEVTMNSDKFVDYEKIFRFDPAPVYFGGAGDAGAWLGAADDFVYNE